MKVTILLPTLKSRSNKLQKCIQKILDNTSYTPYEIHINIDPTKDYVEKIKLMSADVKDGLVLYFADDIEVEENWLKIAVDKYKDTFGQEDGLLAFYDGIQNGRIATHGLTTPSFISKWWYTGYKHFEVGLEMTKVAKRLNKFVYCETSKALHMHHSVGKSELDDVYKANIDDALSDDKILMEERIKLSDNYQNLNALKWT